MKIQGREIGNGKPVYIIAEMSANHQQDFEIAVKTIYAAKQAGADAVKLQTYTPDTMTIRSKEGPFQLGGGTLWDGKNLYDLYAEAYTPWEWHPKLKKLAEKVGIHLFSTAFDETAVDFLEKMKVPVHKIASFEIVDIPLIEKMGRTKKPMIISTGMAKLHEIDLAVQTAYKAGATQIALLKCTSAYPAPPEEMNLRTIPALASTFGVPAGLSDHTLGIAVPTAAVALGAAIIEKHFILSRTMKGPDSAFSLEPAEFRQMVDAVRTVEKAMGTVQFGSSKHQDNSLKYRRSLFVVKPVRAGEAFTAQNIRCIRPGHGMAPQNFSLVMGRTASRDLPEGTPLAWDHLGQAVLSDQGKSRRSKAA